MLYNYGSHTHKLHVNVFLANSFGSRIDPTSGQKTRTEKKVETLYIIGMETSHFTLKDIRRAQVKVGLRLERRYSQRQNFAIFPVDGSVCQEKFGIHSIAAVCC